ncbi:malectin domain-containing carbohydrate-binding protein [Lunatimonas salinarum]|uniref:malectin domain-containing carbohydrate-binding protein n=1 Tax=Lunatimonas salinarum TaxID=1774590 RepID=UPI001ADEE5CC|nr:malectin domain-containing carbohydrate-binding protein [Lunatimonas salinarum]
MKKLSLFALLFFAAATMLQSQTISFNQASLDFKEFDPVNFGTSLKFGPDERLYVAQLNGVIKVYTIFKSGPNSYEVVGEEVLMHVKEIPNHDDTGSLAFDNRNNRQITGITVAGTSSNPVIYATSSDPKWGGPSGDKLLDTNSGIITRIIWNGTTWDAVDIVRGLPRSEENHSTNGLEYTEIGGKPYLLVASGGLTNAGAPSKNFAYITEYALSAAILSVDLEAIDLLGVSTDAVSGRKFIYDIPTLDDPTRPNLNGIYNPNDPNYNGVDVNDPFGGNDGLNMAMVVENGPVQVFSPGFRNAYDLVVTESGKVFATDNGANINWGGLPIGEGDPALVSNAYDPDEPGNGPLNPTLGGEHVDNQDHLLLITADLESYVFGSFYGGHPTPIRANPGTAYAQGSSFPYEPGGAGLYTKFVGDDGNWANITPLFTPSDGFRTQIMEPVAPGGAGYEEYAANSLPANWPPVPLSMANPAEADFIAPTLGNPNGPPPAIVTVFPNNTNGIDEYKASNFNGALKGALIAGKNGGDLHLVQLNEDGSLKSIEVGKWNLNGGNALGISTNGDGEIFPGTIWVATFDNRIMVLTPADDVFCVEIDDPDFDPLADYDYDGYTNQDELDNATDYCSGASRPSDYDQDLVSDLNDLDDDGDGLEDWQDPIQLGDPNDLPIDNELFTNQIDTEGRQYGYLGLGLTGFMNNGAPNPNWMNWIDRDRVRPGPNDIFGGTAGAIQISLTGGTANGPVNSQEKGFQFGAIVGIETGPFVVSAGIIGLASPGQLFDFDGAGEVGIQMGTGTQSDFFKLVFTKSHVVAVQEISDVPQADSLFVDIPFDDIGPNTLIKLGFEVDPYSGEVRPFFKLDNEPVVYLGSMLAAGPILTAVQDKSSPLAVGVYGTSRDFEKSFIGVWNYFRVIGEQPFAIRKLSKVSRLMDDPDLQINLGQYFDDNEGLQQLTFTVEEITDPKIGVSIADQILTLDFPNDEANGLVTIRATDQSGFFVEQRFEVDVQQDVELLLRINAGGPQLAGGVGSPNWLANALTGPMNTPEYSVNSGRGFTNVFNAADRHPSIPAYISDETYTALFNRERFATDPEMTFRIPLPNGSYIVNLYMGNGFDGTSTPLKRVFDIEIEDEVVASQMDLVTEFGHKVGGMKSYPVLLQDGELTINFVKIIENPLVNGIEIVGKPIQTPILFDVLEDRISFAGDEPDGSLIVRARGGDGNLSYQASGLPPGLFIDPTNGLIYGKIADDALANSPYRVRVTIDDEDEISSDAEYFNFTWTISPPLESQSWTLRDESTSYTGRHENAFVQAGKNFYLMGGRENARTIDVYDFEKDKWESLENISPKDFNHFQAIEYGGYIWVIGAFETNNYPDEVPAENIWLFDPSNKIWIMGPEIPEERRRGGAGLVLHRDKFYLVNGNKSGHRDGYVNFLDEFNPKTGEWTILDNSPRPRDHFFATVIGNKMYVAGGRKTGGPGGVFGPVIPEVDVYDFLDKSWSTLPEDQNLPTPRAGAITNNYLGKLIVAGGEVPDAESALDVTEFYDPSVQQWQSIATMNFPRHGTQGIVSGKGLYVLGGSPNRGDGNQKNMEYFGFDEPMGVTLRASDLEMASELNVKKGVNSVASLTVAGGNSGIYVRSMEIEGEDADSFIWLSSNKRQDVFWAAGHVEEITLGYIGTNISASAELKIVFGDGNEQTMLLTGDGVFEPVSLFVNAGSNQNVNYEGNLFVSDNSAGISFTQSRVYGNSQAASEPLFQTERFASSLSYQVEVPNGVYDLITYHNETWFGKPNGGEAGPGKRVFSIIVQGIPVQTNIDLFQISNNQPTSFSFEDVEVTDGILSLSLVAQVNNATISGFQLISKEGGNAVPIARIGTSNTSGIAPLTVQFSGSESSGVQPLSFAWDFGNGSSSSSESPLFTYSSPGVYEVRLTVTDAFGTEDTESIEISVFDAPPSFGFYLNAGTGNTATLDGNVYQGDLGFPSYVVGGRTNSTTISGVNPLYHTERFAKDIQFAIPVPNGIYNVTTHHNELWFGRGGPASQPGNRVFNIGVEGAVVDQNVDLFLASADGPVAFTYEDILVIDGVLNISLSAVVNNATISGISITSADDQTLLSAVAEASILNGVAPLEVSFNAENSIGEGVLGYLWDFGDGTSSELAALTKTFTEPGVYSVVLTVTNGEDATATDELEIIVLETAPLNQWHFNTGSTTTVNWNGIDYVGDALTPSIYSSNNSYSNSAASSSPLFQTERFSTNLSYALPVENGIYTVKTYHNELWFGKGGPVAAPGLRVFDIFLEGQLVKENFDIFVEGNNEPTELVFDGVIVSDGILNLNLVRAVNNASISGLSIIQLSSLSGNERVLNNPRVSVNRLEIPGVETIRGHASLYPNPTRDHVTVDIPASLKVDQLFVSDMQGRIVASLGNGEILSGSVTVSLNELNAGVYTVHLVSDMGHVQTLRLLIRK